MNTIIWTMLDDVWLDEQLVMVGSDLMGIDELELGSRTQQLNIVSLSLEIISSGGGEEEDTLDKGEGKDDCLLVVIENVLMETTSRIKWN